MTCQQTASDANILDGIHRAGWIVRDPRTVLPNGYVLVEKGLVRAVGPWGKKTPPGTDLPVHDHGPGALIPALVNAHTHLELSCFKDKISSGQGFSQWVQDLLGLRERCTAPEMVAGAKLGIEEMTTSGTATVCEISSLGLTAEIVADAGLQGLWCREFLGNRTAFAKTRLTQPGGRIQAAVAGHAPHTMSPGLLTDLKQVTEKLGLPFSIHLAESAAEMEFITSGRGAWADFLNSRDIDYSNWRLPARSPVAYLAALGILDARTLAVHVLQADAEDLDLIKQHQATVCVCPRSNQALHGCLPDIPAMLGQGILICLGTDSLASTSTLNIFDEMAFIAAQYVTISPRQILQMATLNGASALGQTPGGTIAPGGDACMIYVPVGCMSERSLLESIVNKDFTEPCVPLFPAGTPE